MLYERPPYYAISHILIGFIAVWYPLVGIVGVIYQLIQYIFNIRVFPITMSIKNGNNLGHTSLKLVEIGLGYALGYVIKPHWPKLG